MRPAANVYMAYYNDTFPRKLQIKRVEDKELMERVRAKYNVESGRHLSQMQIMNYTLFIWKKVTFGQKN